MSSALTGRAKKKWIPHSRTMPVFSVPLEFDYRNVVGVFQKKKFEAEINTAYFLENIKAHSEMLQSYPR